MGLCTVYGEKIENNDPKMFNYILTKNICIPTHRWGYFICAIYFMEDVNFSGRQNKNVM